MLGINDANNFRARLFGVDHRTNDAMPSLDEGMSIPLATPYVARFGNFATRPPKMFNQDSLLKEYLPSDHPNFMNQAGSEQRMADIVQSAFFAAPPAINGDQADVINHINALEAQEQKAYQANLGRDNVAEAISEKSMKMSMESYEAKHANLIKQGFTNQEASEAISNLRKEQAKKIAQQEVPPNSSVSMETALESAFRNRVRA